VSDPAALTATVRGRVQGVYYRVFVAEQARRLGLTGYARNLANGESVGVVAEGARADLEKLVLSLREGPPLALVANVALVWSEYRGEYRDFTIRH
jgi:acylphosphatase